MANRMFKQFQLTLEADTVSLYGQVVIGSSGAVSAVSGGGIANVVKESTAGQYSISLDDKYSRLLEVHVRVMDDSVSSVAAVQILEDPAAIQAEFKADSTVKIQCLDFAGSAVNPASGAALIIKLVMRNSSVGPFDT